MVTSSNMRKRKPTTDSVKDTTLWTGRIDSAVLDKLNAQAEDEDRTTASLIRKILREAVEK